MKLTLIILTSIFFSLSANAMTLQVKFRDNPVNVKKNGFENFKKSSSLINDSWYDKNNNYLILNIQGTNYHYCGFTPTDWNKYKNAGSLGRHYIRYIRGKFDCRQIPSPHYN